MYGLKRKAINQEDRIFVNLSYNYKDLNIDRDIWRFNFSLHAIGKQRIPENLNSLSGFESKKYMLLNFQLTKIFNKNFELYLGFENLGNYLQNNPIIDFDFSQFEKGSYIFTKSVDNPEEFGVAQMDNNGNVISIDEKPIAPKSDLAVVGIYIFDETVFEKINTLSPSLRGEYEITDLCNIYVKENTCKNFLIDGWWIDAGTPDRIIELEDKLR